MWAVVEGGEEGLIGNAGILYPLLEVQRYLVVENVVDEGSGGRDMDRAFRQMNTVRYPVFSLRSHVEPLVDIIGALWIPPTNR